MATGQEGITGRLIDALKRDQFVLYCQPIRPIGSVTDEAGYQEILIRFREEEEKLLHPGGFFPILESNNLMAMLDRWVVNRVIQWLLAKRKAQKNWSAPRCSINLSVDSIKDAGFSKFVKEKIQANKLEPGKLSFEISETDAGAHALALDQLILTLKPLGCSFAITSYSGESISAEMLQALGINFVKIDGRITRNIHRDDKSFANAKTIHLACQAIEIRTIGELVEIPETLEKLKELGVNYAQGYGISKPAPLE